MANAGGTTNLGLAKDPGVSVRVWRALDSIDARLNRGLALTGATAATRYVGGHATGAPSTGTFAAGDFVVTLTGKVFVCTVAGTPGTWANAGIADQGLPLGLTGAVEASRYAGATTTGNPGSGTFAVGDFVVSQAGTAYVCTVAGTPGTWVEVGSANVTSTVNAAKGQPAVVTGSTTATRFAGGTVTGAPVAGAHSLGDLVVAQDGGLWVCTAAGTPGTWAAAAIAGGATESVSTDAAVTGTKTMAAVSTARYYDYTLSDTVVITAPAAAAGVTLTVRIKQAAAGAKAVTWSGVKWAGGTAPTITVGANAIDLLELRCVNATAGWVGSVLAQDVS